MLATIRFVHEGPSYSMCSITLVVFVTVIFLVSPEESCQPVFQGLLGLQLLVDTGYFKLCVLPVSFLGFHLRLGRCQWTQPITVEWQIG